MTLKKRKWSIPETIQTSAMDCGPACLKSIAAGYGLNIDYDRLRSLCHTNVDGTSISNLEDVLKEFGFDVIQQAIPLDFVINDPKRYLPSITFIDLGNENLHFNVIWRKNSNKVQIMDPSSGRRIENIASFVKKMHFPKSIVSIDDWRSFAFSKDFIEQLQNNLVKNMKILTANAEAVVNSILGKSSYRSIAELDALIRFIGELNLELKTKFTKNDRATFFNEMLNKILVEDQSIKNIIPKDCWYARYFDDQLININEIILVAPIFLTIKSPPKAVAELQREKGQNANFSINTGNKKSPISLGLNRYNLDPVELSFLGVAIIFSAFALIAQFFIFKFLTGYFQLTGEPSYKGALFVGLISVLIINAFVEYPILSIVKRFGRKIEGLYRINFINKLKQIRNEYFETRLKSDMFDRIHSVSKMRNMPRSTQRRLEVQIKLVAKIFGLWYVFPQAFGLILAFLGLTFILSNKVSKFMQEIDLSRRVNLSALVQYNADAFMGAEVLKSQNCYDSFWREYRVALSRWKLSVLKFNSSHTMSTAIYAIYSTTFCFALTYLYFKIMPASADAYLFLIWMVNITDIVNRLPELALEKVGYINHRERLEEPLRAEEIREDGIKIQGVDNVVKAGVNLEFKNVVISRGGKKVLNGVNLSISAGEHVAIVGRSGSGKSTILGCLLGKWVPSEGEILVNGDQVSAESIRSIFPYIAWVDPDTKIWNQTLYNNIVYSTKSWGGSSHLGRVQTAAIAPLLQSLAKGSQTNLGEDGGTISGGEGQRVRFARALNQANVRLALLDEPLRGLEKDTRIDLLYEARNHWREATMLCVMHEIALASEFDKVIVVDSGVVVEVGEPRRLLRKKSYFADMLESEQQMNLDLWKRSSWKKFYLANHKVVEGIEVDTIESLTKLAR
ncbi:MAG: ATP-binding cassette domain-containing protein [Oligoflexales bacterium]|nr:ATP-binding cassette domain-containing protein [Oligoflexales bacterium]